MRFGIKNGARVTWRAVKWLLLGLVGVELLSFAVITTSNWIIYGNLREGPKAVYDPYTLFQMAIPIWPTVDALGQDFPPQRVRTVWFFGGSTMGQSLGPDVGNAIAALIGQPQFWGVGQVDAQAVR